MHLTELLRHKQLVVVGLNSGTSADGLDLAALRIGRSGRAIELAFLAGEEKRFPQTLRQTILEAADSEDLSLKRFLTLHNELGHFAGKAAQSFVRRLKQRRVLVDAVAWHGQTIGHYPRLHRIGSRLFSATLQVGLPELVAAATGTVVVSDVRQGDIALGGEGAPITVAAVHRLFAGRNDNRLIVNIGGMANFFFLPRNGKVTGVRAADCGPGNVLLDLLVQELYGKPYDRNGAIARTGTVNTALLKQLLANPFFGGKARSTGRESFGPTMAHEILEFGQELQLKNEDLLATAVELTAEGIARAVSSVTRRSKEPTKLYLTGGGRRNKLLVQRLSRLVPQFEISMIDELGIPGGLVEAASYAVMGEAALRGEALPTRFGLHIDGMTPVSGRIVQPPQQMPT